MKNMLLITLLLFSFIAEAQNIRNTPVPTASITIQQFGYSSSVAQAMLNGTRDDLWAKIPSHNLGWSGATFALKNRLIQAGFDDPLSNVVINMCKVYARDPHHCVVYAATVACAESSCGRNASFNNVFGMNDPKKSNRYSSRTDAVRDWIIKGLHYNERWFTANEGVFYGYCAAPYYCRIGVDYDVYFFYSNDPAKLSTSHYCTGETNPKVDGYCPNGYGNAKTAYLIVR